jgi:hypothetical protein
MIKDTLARLDAAIARAQAIKGGDKAELVALLEKLKAEVSALGPDHAERAGSVANFAHAAAHEAARPDGDEQLKNISIEGLSKAVKQFEVSHPVLTDTVNDICLMLARMGI